MTQIGLLLLLTTLLTPTTMGARNKSAFLAELFKNYDNTLKPNFDDDTVTTVGLEVFVGAFDSISESSMDYKVTVFVRQRWHDPRLTFDPTELNNTKIVLDHRLHHEMWVPDLFFNNEKTAHLHTMTVPNQLMRFDKDGMVLYSARISLTLSCSMILYSYPLDTQYCSIQLESFGYTEDHLKFEWKMPKPVTYAPDLEPPQFHLTRHKLGDCSKVYPTGTFSCVNVTFVLERQVGYYLMQIYVPSILLVLLSWVNFCISEDAVPARISIGILTILSITTQTSGVRATLPRVSYVKSIDVWLTVCLIFTFLALVEFALVNALCRIADANQHTIKNAFKSGMPGIADTKVQEPTTIKGSITRKHVRMVDTISRFVFPLTFIIFNGLYWPLSLMSLPYERYYDVDY